MFFLTFFLIFIFFELLSFTVIPAISTFLYQLIYQNIYLNSLKSITFNCIIILAGVVLLFLLVVMLLFFRLFLFKQRGQLTPHQMQYNLRMPIQQNTTQTAIAHLWSPRKSIVA